MKSSSFKILKSTPDLFTPKQQAHQTPKNANTIEQIGLFRSRSLTEKDRKGSKFRLSPTKSAVPE